MKEWILLADSNKSEYSPTQVWEPFTDATTGICMVGTFASEPYQDEDWSGKGRVTYYADLDIDFLTDPEKSVILSTEELMAAIPDYAYRLQVR